jgi:Tol biopolymer transport system component
VISTTDGFRTLAKANTEIDTPKMSPDGSKIAYADGANVRAVDISTEESQKVADGRMAAWLDGDTLIVAPET